MLRAMGLRPPPRSSPLGRSRRVASRRPRLRAVTSTFSGGGIPRRDSRIPLDAIDGDWIKRGRWDLDGIGSVDELVSWLAREGISVADFKLLDVYRANVDRLPWLAEL